MFTRKELDYFREKTDDMWYTQNTVFDNNTVLKVIVNVAIFI